jgi:hypothetical protein
LFERASNELVRADPPTRASRRAGFDLHEVWSRC